MHGMLWAMFEISYDLWDLYAGFNYVLTVFDENVIFLVNSSVGLVQSFDCMHVDT